MARLGLGNQTVESGNIKNLTQAINAVRQSTTTADLSFLNQIPLNYTSLASIMNYESAIMRAYEHAEASSQNLYSQKSGNVHKQVMDNLNAKVELQRAENLTDTLQQFQGEVEEARQESISQTEDGSGHFDRMTVKLDELRNSALFGLTREEAEKAKIILGNESLKYAGIALKEQLAKEESFSLAKTDNQVNNCYSMLEKGASLDSVMLTLNPILESLPKTLPNRALLVNERMKDVAYYSIFCKAQTNPEAAKIELKNNPLYSILDKQDRINAIKTIDAVIHRNVDRESKSKLDHKIATSNGYDAYVKQVAEEIADEKYGMVQLERDKASRPITSYDKKIFEELIKERRKESFKTRIVVKEGQEQAEKFGYYDMDSKDQATMFEYKSKNFLSNSNTIIDEGSPEWFAEVAKEATRYTTNLPQLSRILRGAIQNRDGAKNVAALDTYLYLRDKAPQTLSDLTENEKAAFDMGALMRQNASFTNIEAADYVKKQLTTPPLYNDAEAKKICFGYTNSDGAAVAGIFDEKIAKETPGYSDVPIVKMQYREAFQRAIGYGATKDYAHRAAKLHCSFLYNTTTINGPKYAEEKVLRGIESKFKLLGKNGDKTREVLTSYLAEGNVKVPNVVFHRIKDNDQSNKLTAKLKGQLRAEVYEYKFEPNPIFDNKAFIRILRPNIFTKNINELLTDENGDPVEINVNDVIAYMNKR